MFLREGIRFECQGSGRCCTSRGAHGYVYLTLSDRKRFAKYFGISTAKFTRKYCRKTDGWFHLRHPENDCEFLKDKRCAVYEARPSQCRTWPFWPENMNAKAWRSDVASFCPGVGKGKVYSAEEIREILKIENS
jgi:uncharacterized protein